MQSIILGISAYYHDSAACLLIDGDIVAAAEEERFTRKKHDAKFPSQAILYCLREADISLSDVDHIVFYDMPWIKFHRLLGTFLCYAPKGLSFFLKVMNVWLSEKLFLSSLLKKELRQLSSNLPKRRLPEINYIHHHHSHAASAFFPSPYDNAIVICMDGVGEWDCTSIWIGDKNTLTKKLSIKFPHSLGLLYSAFTYYAGFKINSGEYKLMGLAPYGKPQYVDIILKNLLDLKEDGSFRLNMDYFCFPIRQNMINKKFCDLFGAPPRRPESTITQKEMDIARSIQSVTEMIVLRIANSMHKQFNIDNVCLAGGVALNCVANGRILRESSFKQVWIQPAAGDAGGALGAALAYWHEVKKQPRKHTLGDKMKFAYLGPQYTQDEIFHYLGSANAAYDMFNQAQLILTVAKLLAQGKIVAWFRGRMEFGPRALGARSILGNPCCPKMQSIMNLKIKHRESFRPFAPIVKEDKAPEWFDINIPSPYMMFVAPITNSKRKKNISEKERLLKGLERLKIQRSDIPAVTHLDYSARIQTVSPISNSVFYHLLDEFEKLTHCPILINTSFNVRGEPIVCSPKDAYSCFMNTEIDFLVLENYLLDKSKQSAHYKNNNESHNFVLD